MQAAIGPSPMTDERRACRTLGQHRSSQRKIPQGRSDEERLTADIIELARQYGRYGYRRITALLNQSGWHVNHKRVERIWKREGLKVPQKQPKKGRLYGIAANFPEAVIDDRIFPIPVSRRSPRVRQSAAPRTKPSSDDVAQMTAP